MLLYAVTDQSWLGSKTVAEVVEEAVAAGATFVQLREKEASDRTFMEAARAVKAVTDRYQVPLVINDNVAVAMAVDADGVHVGQEDMPVAAVRGLIGPDKILGVSAQNAAQAVAAQNDGADYIGVGAVFASPVKPDAGIVAREELTRICQAVSIPVVAIGGITAQNILELKGAGIDGVAVVSAIFARPDIGEATAQLLTLAREMVGN
jgi:thiamine-phosphate diphosphorylase